MSNVRQAIMEARVLLGGHFVLASGEHAMLKLEMDNLWKYPEQLEQVLDRMAHLSTSLELKALSHSDFEVILGVPTGGQRLAEELVRSGRVKVPLARLERVPGGRKQDFRFVSEEDEQLARSSKRILIYEDVVTTGSSVAGVVRLLDPLRQEIHMLAIWRRGKVKEEFRVGITEHYLVEEEISSFPPDQCPFLGCRG